MADPFLGEIALVAFDFPPVGWANCDGQLMNIAQNSALFSLFGAIYGGDGETTFALPDLQGRSPMHFGDGPGLTSRPIGVKGGSESVTLTTAQIPAHSHPIPQPVANTPGTQSSPVGAAPAITEQLPLYRNAADANVPGNAGLQNTGGGQPHENMAPFLVIRFIVALTGIFPSRS